MSEPPLVSVIIPTFNSARWLRDTIESVLAQTHRPLEVIIGDNGSTDGTREIAASYGSRLTLVHAHERGPGAARNAGLDAARGEYVQFVDSDDLLEPWKIERQLVVLRKTGADLVWGPYWTYEEDSSTGAFALGERRDPDLSEDAAVDLIDGAFLQIGSVLQRQSPVLAPLRFLPSEHLEEIDYQLRAALLGARFVKGSGDSGLLFRQHSGLRVSHGIDLRTATGALRNVRMLKAWWSDRDELTPARRSALIPPLLYAARVMARQAPELLSEVLGELRSLEPHFERRLPWKLQIPARLLGYERMEHVARSYRAARALLSSRRPPSVRKGA